jgi:hypothetical protein
MRSRWLKPSCHAWRCMAASLRLTPSLRERAFTQAVVDLRGYDLLSVQENQPTLYNDLQTYFNDPEACFEQAQTIDRHKGRLEARQIRVTTSMNAYLDCWPGLAQVARTLAQRHHRRKTRATKWSISSRISHHSKPALIAYSSSSGVTGVESMGCIMCAMSPFRRTGRTSGRATLHKFSRRSESLVITLILRQGSTQIAVTRRWFAFHKDESPGHSAFLLRHSQ